MPKELILQNGMTAIVDDEDYDRLNSHTWTLISNEFSFYVATGKYGKVRLANKIIDIPKGKVVFFKNGNRLDFRKQNLIAVDEYKKATMSRARKGSSSKYKGVCWDNRSNKWRVRIAYKGSRLNIGYFENEEEAAMAYNEAAIRTFGEGAYLNKIGFDNRNNGELTVPKIDKTEKTRRNSSKFRGVYYKKDRWCSSIRFNGKTKHIGYFESEIEAAKAYNETALEIFKEKAILNEFESEVNC